MPQRDPLELAKPVDQQAASTINVMIVDDSLTVRTVFSRMIGSDPALNIAATANSGEAALDQLTNSDVDVILLDLEMPGMGGLKALPKLLAAKPGVQILVVSSLAQDGAEHTVAALSMGAADTLQKPQSGDFNNAYRLTLLEKIRALGEAMPESAGKGSPPADQAKLETGLPPSKFPAKRPKIVAFGASTGGIHALNIVLRALPKAFSLPIVITQHLPANFMPIFARQIETASGRRTRLAEQGAKVCRGEILIATGKGHMGFTQTGDQVCTRVSSEPAPSNCLPSVDPMLASLAQAYSGHVLAVILSGMGRDGLEGAKELVAAGGSILAQDAKSSAVWGMPGAITNAGLAKGCFAPDEIAEAITAAAGVAAWR